MKVILNGANGRMGHVASNLFAQNYDGVELVAKVDAFAPEGSDMYKSLQDYTGPADCVIDFSHHSQASALYQYCAARNLPCIIATTGQTEEEMGMLLELAKVVPVFLSANMSMGIAMLAEFAKQAAAMMPEADIEIVETHHNRKLDAPSGTALLLANAVREVRTDAELVYGRSGQAKRQPNEIGMHSLRMGMEVGIHEVYVGTDSQTIVLTHKAHDRTLFAEGSVKAAKFACAQPAGLYSMQDLFRK